MAAEAMVLQYRSGLGRHQLLAWLAPEATDAPLTLPGADPHSRREIPLAAFRRDLAEPRAGRFYPGRVIDARRRPAARMIRVVRSGDPVVIDTAHPLAGRAVQAARIEETALPPGRAGIAEALGWAGMEAPLEGQPTDFDEPDARAREDETEDAAFYAEPRRLLHIDTLCAARIRALYQRLLPAGAEVLDLMAGWASHLEGTDCRVRGLGMNAAEMADNPALDGFEVRDLNRDPRLPHADASLDAVINSVSFEYLTDPDAVLAEVRRVLRPGGLAVITCSHRYFPTKAIRLWTRLHPMERLGWVAQRLAAAGLADLVTHTERGLPRPADDRYSGQIEESDPLFAAWGRRPASG